MTIWGNPGFCVGLFCHINWWVVLWFYHHKVSKIHNRDNNNNNNNNNNSTYKAPCLQTKKACSKAHIQFKNKMINARLFDAKLP